MNCKYEKYINKFLDGILNEKGEKLLLEHAKQCSECSNKLKKIENIDTLIKDTMNDYEFKTSKNKVMAKIEKRKKIFSVLPTIYALRRYAYAIAIILFLATSVHLLEPRINKAFLNIKSPSVSINDNSDENNAIAKAKKSNEYPNFVNFPDKPGIVKGTIWAGGPEPRELYAEFETAVVKDENGSYMVTFTQWWSNKDFSSEDFQGGIDNNYWTFQVKGNSVTYIKNGGTNTPPQEMK